MHVASVHTAPQLLEREHELEAVGGALARAAAGAGGVLLIEGPPGVGKSRLLADARRSARELGIRVLDARGAVLEREFGFGVVRQLFEPVVIPLPAADREQLFSGAAGLAASLLGDPGLPLPPEHGDATFGALHALYWLAVNLADRGPLLLSIDDAHWSDSPSLRFLGYLSRRLEGVPILLVATGRSSDPETDELWRELAEDPAATVLRPCTLSTTAVCEVIRRRLGPDADDAFCQACHRATAGNPLFLHELVGALAAAAIAPTADAATMVTEVGPPAVARFVLHRLERMGPSAAALAQAVAVHGGDAELKLAAQTAGLDPGEARAVADLLVRADVFAPHPLLRFAHPIVQAAVYEDLLPGERAARHRAVAGLLERAGAPAERVAAHLVEAGPTGESTAIAILRSAAADAGDRGDPAGAAAYLRRALEEAPGEGLRPELLCDLGRIEVAIRAFDSAHNHLAAVLRDGAAAELRTRAGVWLARAAITSGEPQLAHAAYEAIVSDLEAAVGDGALELEAELVNLVRMELSLRHVSEQWLARFRSDASGHPMYEPIARIHTCAEELIRGEPAAPRADEIETMLSSVPPTDPFAFGVALECLVVTERYATASRWLDLALQSARTIGFGTRIANLHTQRACVALARGALGEAHLDASTALELAGTDHFYAPRVIAVAAQVELERGELEAARALIERGGSGVARERLFVDEFLTSRGNLRIARGELREGLEDLLRCGELHAQYGTRRPVDWRAGAVWALAELDQKDRAEELAGEGLAIARRFGAPRALTRALRSAGSVTEGDAGIALLEEAVEVAERSDVGLEGMYAHAALGSALVARRRRREGRSTLRTALEQARKSGATAMAQRLLGELGAGGGRPPQLELTGLDALTPAERRVCDLAARDMSNREVAQTLFVTEKTVELHLTNAYRKLGIRSRFQLSSVIPVTVAAD